MLALATPLFGLAAPAPQSPKPDAGSSVPEDPARARPGGLFKGTFQLSAVADTYLDLSGYQKGYVWVNGHNLGRYWNIGPQQRLYCPAPWLRRGANEVLVLDLLQTEPKPIAGKETLTD